MCVCSNRYPACNVHAPNWQLWPARLNIIFPHLISSMIYLKKNTRSFNHTDHSFAISRVSDRPSAWNNPGSTGWIFIKFDIWVFFKNLMTKLISHEVQYIQLIIYCSLLLRMKNISDRSWRENEMHVFCVITFFF